MALALTTSRELQIELEPARIENRIPSVAFDIRVVLSMPFQETLIRIKECWFSHEALNQFEEELADLRSTEDGKATLANMSELPIIEISRTGNAIVTTVRSSDTVGMSATTLQMNGYAVEVAEMLEHIRNYEKWW